MWPLSQPPADAGHSHTDVLKTRTLPPARLCSNIGPHSEVPRDEKRVHLYAIRVAIL